MWLTKNTKTSKQIYSLDGFLLAVPCQAVKVNKQYRKLLLAMILEQLSDWCVGVLLEEANHFTQRALLNEVLLSVEGECSSTANWRAIAISAAVSIPHVFWDIDTFDIILDDPVVSRGNGTDQHVGLVTLSAEHLRQRGLMIGPRFLVQFWVLRHYVCEGERSITAQHWVDKRVRSLN